MKYFEISKKSKPEILKLLKTKEDGISIKEAQNRLERDGKNISTDVKKRTPFYFLFKAFNDKFIWILVILAVINYIGGYLTCAIITICIGIMSGLITFVQDYSTYKFNEKLKQKIRSKANVIRSGKQIEIFTENIVQGDIISLSAGTIIPADLILIDSKDLFINQASFTGENMPVEKKAGKPGKETDDAFNIQDICLMGSSVISGNGTGVVITTGLSTYIGKMNKDLDKKRLPTNFENGMNKISSLLMRYMIVISVIVFIVYGLIRKDVVEALFFALSVAVGITPTMLPMIVNVNLTKGTKELAKKKTLVKNTKSIQNIGSMDILCTDKTGTLTMNNIVLQKFLNVKGDDDDYVLKCAYINSSLSTGLKNLVDKAVISYGKKNNVDISDYQKVDEIPFDYVRKIMSILVTQDDHKVMISKGAVEEILSKSTNAIIDGEKVPITYSIKEEFRILAKDAGIKGMQVIAIAVKYDDNDLEEFNKEDEENLNLIGLVAFLDPPKKDASKIIKDLKEKGIRTKVLTGDNEYATKTVCDQVEICGDIIIGSQIEKMSDKELSATVEKVDIFARMNPMQKERVVETLRRNGHVVGFMGDGVNDAQSLHNADVGISVNSAADIAKEASDIILLEKSLNVVYDGVIEGRIVYGNIIKYLKLALSSDYGDVFSIMIASLFLPFLPLLPIQMLIQDFLFQLSQSAIPYDTVEDEFIEKPRRWDTKDLGKFMQIMGMISSITDVLAFLIFWFILGYNSVAKQSYFQTAWFIECIISETLIIYYIRTSKVPFIQSKPSKPLFIMTLVTVAGTIVTPYLLHSVQAFNFEIMPPIYYVYIVGLSMLYALIVQTIKHFYIKKNGSWL